MRKFSENILSELQELVETEDIKTMTFRASTPDNLSMGMSPTIKLVHDKLNIEITCDEYETQIENKAVALVRMAKILSK